MMLSYLVSNASVDVWLNASSNDFNDINSKRNALMKIMFNIRPASANREHLSYLNFSAVQGWYVELSALASCDESHLRHNSVS